MRGQEPLKLMCILAHPDDESFGVGGTLARYADEGVEISLVTATRGERGWPGPPNEHPGPDELGRMREAELRAAARELGIRRVEVLDYRDGELETANPTEIIARIVALLREVRPQVVATFDPEGGTGHPDHIAISQFTTAAIVCAADPHYGDSRTGGAHRVAKLYYLAPSNERVAAYSAVFGGGGLRVNDEVRHASGWADWAITTRIDASAYWRQAWQAITCHQTQLSDDLMLARVPEEQHRLLWGVQEFYRAFSVVAGPEVVEQDLFAGLRSSVLTP